MQIAQANVNGRTQALDARLAEAIMLFEQPKRFANHLADGPMALVDPWSV